MYENGNQKIEMTKMKTKSQIASSPSTSLRRSLTAQTVVASFALATATMPVLADGPSGIATQGAHDTIRPFHVKISDEALADLRRRIHGTAWPDKELVADSSQGVQLALMQKLARYWATDYDWRKVEARLNALPQFITKIDGLDIHFIHVRSKQNNALPMIVTHGWPGSIIEQLKIIEPLTNPTEHGGSASDAFDVVIP